MKKYLFAVVALAMLSACSNKQEPIDELEDLCEQISQEGDKFSEEDWDETSAKLEEIDSELDEHADEYTAEERREIMRLKGKIAAQSAKKTMKKWAEQLETVGEDLENLLEGFSEGLEDVD